MDTEEVENAELEAWREDPITVRLVRRLETKLVQDALELRAAASMSNDATVRAFAYGIAATEAVLSTIHNGAPS